MPIDITMPALSPTMEEGTLAKWHVAEGDDVTPGDVICEIETDKATMEVEAVDEGTIGRILVTDGTENVKVNSVIAVLLEEGESTEEISDISSSVAVSDKPAPSPEQNPDTPSSFPTGKEKPAMPAPDLVVSTARSEPPQTFEGSGHRIFASPLARRMAKDAGLSLSALNGSGPRGRIVKTDVENAIQNGIQAIAMPTPAPSTSSSRGLPGGMGANEVKALYEEGTYDIRPNDGMRTVVAQRLTEAKQTIPHFYLNIDCRLDNLLAARADINASAPKKDDGKPDFRLSVNDFIVKAWALALQKVPDANATWAGDFILYHHRSDVAVAVAVPGGLFTPVVRSADIKSLKQISVEVRDFAIRARSKKLAPPEYQGGSSSISNLGMYGINHFSAVINPPHGTILAVGAGEERVFADHGKVSTGTFMTVTLSCDHRSVDGVLGAQALNAFKQMIEQPVMMLV